MALKLLNDILIQSVNQEELILYVEKKILRRLSILARTKKESNDINRGALMFGKEFNTRASADFLKLLLVYIQKWAMAILDYPSTGRQTEINKIYQSLLKEKVSIPNEDEVLSTVNFNYQAGNQSVISQQQPVRQSQQLNQDQFQSSSSIQQRPPSNLISIQSQSRQSYNTDQFRTQSQEQKNMPARGGISSQQTQSQSSIAQLEKPAPLSREQQLELAKQVKNDYKKLNEHHQNAKLAEEILSMGGDSGGDIDEELLLQFRGTLNEGKEFSEKFLKILMDSSFSIKDKESKIDKILVIISDISTQLEKILIFKPYSPRSLKDMQKRKALEDDKITQQDPQSIDTPKPQKRQEQKRPMRAPQNDHKRQGLDINDLQQNKPLDDPMGFDKASLDFKADPKQDIFKTNFALSNQSSTNFAFGNDDAWGGFSQSNNFSSKGVQDFFNPIQSSFEPSISQRNQASLEKGEIKPLAQSMITLPKQTIEEESNHEQKPTVQEEPKVQRMVRKNTDKVKTSSNMPNLNLPTMQKPSLIKEVSEKSVIVNDSQETKQTPNSAKEEVKANHKSSPRKRQSDKYPGLKAHSSKPMITSESPSHISDEEENAQLNDEHEEKSAFQFPSPNMKIFNNQAFSSQAPSNDFSWDFNSFSTGQVQTSNKIANQMPAADVYNFPSHRENNSTSQEQVKKYTHAANNGFEFGDKGQKAQSSQQIVKTSEVNKVIKPQKFESSSDISSSSQKKKEPVKELFDFNALDQDQDSFSHSKQHSQESPIKQDSHIVQQLTAQVADLLQQLATIKDEADKERQENNQLKFRETDQRQHFKIMEDKLLALTKEQKVTQLAIQTLENTVKDKDAKIEELEDSVKYYKKYEYLLEQEQYAKATVSNELADVKAKLEEYHKMADRQEHLVNKKEKELDTIRVQLTKLKNENTQMLNSHERDLQDLLESEGETKKLLQAEIFEARKKEEEARIKIKIQAEEYKKAEETIRKSHTTEMKEAQDLNKKVNQSLKQQEVEHNIKFLELQRQIEQQAQDIIKKQNEIDNALHQQQQQQQMQKIVLKPKMIQFKSNSNSLVKSEEFKRESSLVSTPSQQELGNPLPTSFDFQMSQSAREINRDKIDIDSQEDIPLFDSIIKPQSQKPHLESISHFEEPQVKILDHSPDRQDLFSDEIAPIIVPIASLKHQQEQLDKSLTIIKEDEDDEFARDMEDPLEETMPPIPSSDSDQSFHSLEEPKEEIKRVESYSEKIKDYEGKQISQNIQLREQRSMNEDLVIKTGNQEEMKNLNEETKQENYKQETSRDELELSRGISSIKVEKDVKESPKKDLDFWDFFDKKPESSVKESELSPDTDKMQINKFAQQDQNDTSIMIESIPAKKEDLFNMDALLTPMKHIQEIDKTINQPLLNQQANSFLQTGPSLIPQTNQNIQEVRQLHTDQPLVSQTVNQSLSKDNKDMDFLAELLSSKPTQEKKLEQDPFANILQKKSETIKENEMPKSQTSQNNLHGVINNTSTTIQPTNSSDLIMTKQLSQEQQIGTQTFVEQPIQQQIISQLPISQLQSPQKPNNEHQHKIVENSISPPKQDIILDKSQFSTASTEQVRTQQAQEQSSQIKALDPQAMMRQMLLNHYRRALQSPKAVLYEDQILQIGIMAEFTQNQSKIRLFIGAKHPLQNIKFNPSRPYNGLKVIQSRNSIDSLKPGTQEMIEISATVENYQILSPMFVLVNSFNQHSIPVQLPITLLKFCHPFTTLDAQQYLYQWNFECHKPSELHVKFDIDFNICRSLTQMKEVLQLSRHTFSFVDGVEQAKNILCGATQFTMPGHPVLSALMKITVSATGQGCEVVSRTNQEELMSIPPNQRFGAMITQNILELIALMKIAQ